MTVEELDAFSFIQQALDHKAKLTLMEHRGVCDRCEAEVVKKSVRVEIDIRGFQFSRHYEV